MTTSKKLIIMFVSLVMIIGVMAVNAFAVDEIASGKCGENAVWVLTDDGTLTISGEGEMCDYDIEESQWHPSRPLIRRIIVEDGITSIGINAFEECINAESVSIPDSVTSIGAKAFMDCCSLADVTISENVEILGSSAFAGCARLDRFNIAKDNENYVTDEYGVIYSKDKM